MNKLPGENRQTRTFPPKQQARTAYTCIPNITNIPSEQLKRKTIRNKNKRVEKSLQYIIRCRFVHATSNIIMFLQKQHRKSYYCDKIKKHNL